MIKNRKPEPRSKDAQLNLERERYEAIFHSVNDAIFIHDADSGRIIEVNQRALEMFGITPEEILKSDVSNISLGKSPYSVKEALQFIHKAAQGEPQIFEWHARHKDGSLFWVEVSMHRAFIGGNNRVLVLARDISIQKRMDRQLRLFLNSTAAVSGKPFLDFMAKNIAEYLESSIVFIAEYNNKLHQIHTISYTRDGKTLDNIAFDIKGTPDELSFKNRSSTYIPELSENFPTYPLLENNTFYSYFGICLKNANALPIGLLCVINQDPLDRQKISTMKTILEPFVSRASAELLRLRAEREQQKSEEFFKRIVTSSPMGIYIYERTDDDQLILLQSNPAADKSSGIDSSKMSGKTIEEIFPGLAETEIPEIYKKVAITGKPWSTTNLTYEQDGQKGVFDVWAFAVGEKRIAVMFENVTEVRRLQEALYQSQKMESIGKLAGGIAHDFNNVLGGIMGGTELLTDSLKASFNKEQQSFIDVILESTRRAAELTDQLMAFARKETIDFTPLNINQMLQDLVQMLERTIDPRIKIYLNTAPDPIVINGDKTRINNALLNLVLNARDAMPSGGELKLSTSTVTLNEEFCSYQAGSIKPGKFVKIAIRDTGEGIEENHLLHIFEPFFTTKPKGKGTGIGLSTAYGTMLSHNGAICVYSTPNNGTLFQLFFPIAKQAEEHTEAHSTDEIIHGQGHVLLVDDEENILSITAVMLESIGYTVSTATDGQKAIESFTSQPKKFDLIILDLVMPHKSGYDAFNEIRQIDPDIPVLLASGFSARQFDLKSLLGQPAVAFIQKPYRRIKLSHSIYDVMHHQIALIQDQ